MKKTLRSKVVICGFGTLLIFFTSAFEYDGYENVPTPCASIGGSGIPHTFHCTWLMCDDFGCITVYQDLQVSTTVVAVSGTDIACVYTDSIYYTGGSPSNTENSGPCVVTVSYDNYCCPEWPGPLVPCDGPGLESYQSGTFNQDPCGDGG